MAPNRRKVGFSALSLLLNYAKNILTDPKYTYVVQTLLIISELVVNVFIIRRVKYTEIDWSTYMEQVNLFQQGTLDYSKITGPTGPCVYPALHLYIFSILKSITNDGQNILRAQWIFMYIYVLNCYVVTEIYKNLRKDALQPWTLIPMFLLSHRIHSIFVLRLFNDPIAMLLMYTCVMFLTKKTSEGETETVNQRNYILSTIFFTLALNTKMNILLFSPAFAFIYYKNLGLIKSAIHAIFGTFGISVLLGLPFIKENWQSYLSAAFNFSRKFEYKWTVNWRFLGEEVFLDSRLHVLLLALHVSVLVFFLGKFFITTNKASYTTSNKILTSKQIISILFLSNFIGMMFSRSLHYQFLSWYHHTLPALLFLPKFYKSITCLMILGMVEFCWNSYPSTEFSSGLLHVCHGAILYGILKGEGIFGRDVSVKNKDE